MKYIIGSDEVGYGAWAGPLVVYAVGVPKGWCPPLRLRDSKKMTPKARDTVARYMRRDVKVIVAFAQVEADAIDSMGLGFALKASHRKAIQACSKLIKEKRHSVLKIIVDGNIDTRLPKAVAIPKADAKYSCVSAASVFAKVRRDGYMIQLGRQYKGWGFERHKGYGTPQHREWLANHGPIAGIHRFSYKPVREMMS